MKTVKSVFIILILCLATNLFLAGCFSDESANMSTSDNDNYKPNNELYITVSLVEPEKNSIAELSTNIFSVSITYENPRLYEVDIYIGFNHIDQFSVHYLDDFTQTVAPGSGTLTVDVSLYFETWDPKNDFIVYVMLFDKEALLPISENSQTIFNGTE